MSDPISSDLVELLIADATPGGGGEEAAEAQPAHQPLQQPPAEHSALADQSHGSSPRPTALRATTAATAAAAAAAARVAAAAAARVAAGSGLSMPDDLWEARKLDS